METRNVRVEDQRCPGGPERPGGWETFVPMKVLVADDDRTSRSLLRGLLDRWGYEAEAVVDGAEAWEALQRPAAPRMALLDWLMPGLDGLEVCRRVRARSEAEPPYLILLTARGGKGHVVEGLRAGADDYIAKPYDGDELRARLEVGRRMVELRAVLARRVEELEEALADVRTLRGILPICAHCHKIRTDRQSWEQMEKYVTEHSEAQFSHSICPECMQRHYPEFARTSEKERP